MFVLQVVPPIPLPGVAGLPTGPAAGAVSKGFRKKSKEYKRMAKAFSDLGFGSNSPLDLSRTGRSMPPPGASQPSAPPASSSSSAPPASSSPSASPASSSPSASPASSSPSASPTNTPQNTTQPPTPQDAGQQGGPQDMVEILLQVIMLLLQLLMGEGEQQNGDNAGMMSEQTPGGTSSSMPSPPQPAPPSSSPTTQGAGQAPTQGTTQSPIQQSSSSGNPQSTYPSDIKRDNQGNLVATYSDPLGLGQMQYTFGQGGQLSGVNWSLKVR